MSSGGHLGDQGSEQDRDPFEVFTGDPASAARLRTNLSRIAEEHAGTDVASVANEVLAGRRSIRDLADDAEFSVVIGEGVDAYRRYLDSLSPAERVEMIDNAGKSAGQRG